MEQPLSLSRGKGDKTEGLVWTTTDTGQDGPQSCTLTLVVMSRDITDRSRIVGFTDPLKQAHGVLVGRLMMGWLSQKY